MNDIPSTLLPYLTTALGFLAVYVLNGIKAEINEVKSTVQSLEKDMRNTLTDLEKVLL